MFGDTQQGRGNAPRELSVYEDRFCNATSTEEKIQALKDLNQLGRSHPAAVGERILPLILDAIQHDLSDEETSEILEVMHALLHTSDTDAAEQNAQLILQEHGAIASLLDLPSTDSLSATATAFQVLARMHECARAELEAEIQNSPESVLRMLEILQKVEEIRMEVLTLLIAITEYNQEMKKSVAFNEGFNTLFAVMELEGWAQEPTAIVRECLVLCRNIVDDCPTAQRLFVEDAARFPDLLCDFFDIEALSLANLDPEQDGVDYLTPNRVDDTLAQLTADVLRSECMVAALNVLRASVGQQRAEAPLSSSSLPAHAQPQSQDPEGPETRRTNLLSSHKVLPAVLSVLANCRGLHAHVVEAALDMLIVLCEGTPQSQSLLMNTLVRTVRTTDGSDNDPAGLTFCWVIPGIETTQWIPLPTLLGDRYTYCFDAVELLEDEEESLGHSTVATLTRKCFVCLETLLTLDEMGCVLVLQSMVAPAPVTNQLETYDGAFIDGMELVDTIQPLGRVILDALDANMHELTNPECREPLLFGGPANRLVNMLSCVILNGGTMAKALAERVSWKVAVDGDDSGMMGGMTKWAAFSARTALDSQDAADDAFQQAHWLATAALITNIACATESSVALCMLSFAEQRGGFLFELLSEHSTVPLNIRAAACLAIGTSIVTLNDQQVEDGSLEAELRDSQLKDIESLIGVAAFLDILASASNKLKQKKANRKLLSEEWEQFFFCSSFESFFEQQASLIQKTLVEKLALAAPARIGLDQGDQLETIQQLEARIRELEAAASGNADTAPGLDSELAALRERVSEQESEILNLKELINTERNTNKTRAEELAQKAKMVQMMQEEMEQMVSPLEHDRLKLESEKQIQSLQSRLEQQKQSMGNGGPQSDAMIAKIAECERLVEENTEKDVYIRELQETIDRLQRHTDTSIHDQLRDALYALKHIDPTHQDQSTDFDDENIDPNSLANDIFAMAGQVANDVRLYQQQLDDVAAALGQSMKSLVEADSELHKFYKDHHRGDDGDDEDVTAKAELTRELVRRAATRLVDSNEELQEIRAKHERELQQSQDQLSQQLANLKDQVASLLQERAELMKQLDEQEGHLKQREELINQMAEDISERDRRWEQRGNVDSELGAEVARLRQSNQELMSENEQFEAKIADLTTTHASLQESISTLQNQVRKARLDKDQVHSDLTATLQEKNAELQKLRSDNAKLQGALQPVSESNISLKNELASVQREMATEMEVLQQQLQERSDRMSELESGNADLQRTIAELQAKLEASESTATDASCENCALLEEENRTLQADIDTLTSELTFGGKSSAQVQELEQAVQYLKQEVQQLGDENDGLKEANADLEDELQRVRAQAENVNVVTEELNQLHEAYEQLLKAHEKLQSQYKDSLARAEQLSDEAAQGSQLHVQYEEKLKDLTERYNTLEEESQTLAQRLQDEIAGLRLDNDRLRDEVQQLLKPVQTQSSPEQEVLAEALEVARKEAEQMRQRNAATQADYAELQSAYSVLQTKMREWGESSDQRASAQREQLLADNAALQQELADTSTKLSTLEAQVASLTEQMEVEHEAHSNLKENWELVQDENTDLRAQLAKGNGDMKSAIGTMCATVKDIAHAMKVCLESMQHQNAPASHTSSNGAVTGPKSPLPAQNAPKAFVNLSTELEALIASQQQLEQLAANGEDSARVITSLQQLLGHASTVVHDFTGVVAERIAAERAAAAARAAEAAQEIQAPSTATPKKEAATMPAQLGRSPSLRQIREETRNVRQRYNKLQEEHDDLLGMLAQQELVLQTFRDRLRAHCGDDIVSATAAEAKHNVEIEYGLYIDYGEPFAHGDDDLDESVDYNAPRGLALHDSPHGQSRRTGSGHRSPLEMKLFPDEPPL